MMLGVEEAFVWGTGSFAFKCANYLNKIIPVKRIFEYGRFSNSQLEQLCRENNYEYECLGSKEQADDVVLKILESQKSMLILSASNIYIFPENMVKCSNIFIINYHPALLDKHRGRNVEAWCIYDMDVETGVTWHVVTEEIDQGVVLAQKRIKLSDTMTSLKLMTIQYQTAYLLFTEFIGFVISGQRFDYMCGNEKGKMHYSYELPNNGVLDLEWDDQKISAFLRSMDYGKMNVLGNAMVCENKKIYEWSHYKIYRQGEIVVADKNSKVIYGKSIGFELFNYHERL